MPPCPVPNVILNKMYQNEIECIRIDMDQWETGASSKDTKSELLNGRGGTVKVDNTECIKQRKPLLYSRKAFTDFQIWSVAS